MTTISLKLPDELYARLEATARDSRRTKSEIARDALARFLEAGPSSGLSSLDLIQDLAGSVRGPADLSSNVARLKGYGR